MASVLTSRRSRPPAVPAEPFGPAAVAFAAFAGSVLVLLHGGLLVTQRGPGDLDAVGVMLFGLSTLPLLAARRSPFAVFVITAVANVMLAAFVYPIGLPLGPTVALYLLASTRDETSRTIGRTVAIASVLLGGYVGGAAYAEATFPGFELSHLGLLWSAAWFAGERTRLRREQIAELKREAQRERLLAAAEERARIARDLHDSAGHAINVIAVHAGAARLRHPDDPDRSLQALEAIEDLARRTAEDIDRIVGALREPGTVDAVEVPPGLASLDTLLAQHTAAGLDVTRANTGTPRHLGAVVDQAAYRILQESLTNASRHGTGAATVEVAFDDTAVALTVTNPVEPRPLQPGNGGHGLVGMRERAARLDGTFDVRDSNGTFRVSARLPYTTERP